MFGEKKCNNIFKHHVILHIIMYGIYDIIHVIFCIINFYYNYSLHIFEHYSI